MNEEILQQQIDENKSPIKKTGKEPELQDHQHNGIDATKVRFKDLDTIFFYANHNQQAVSFRRGGRNNSDNSLTGATLGDFVFSIGAV